MTIYTTGLRPHEVTEVNATIGRNFTVVEVSGIPPDSKRWIPVLRKGSAVAYVVSVILRKYAKST